MSAEINETFELARNQARNRNRPVTLAVFPASVQVHPPSPSLSARSAIIEWPTKPSPESKSKPASEIVSEISELVASNEIRKLGEVLQKMDVLRRGWILNNCSVGDKPVLHSAAFDGNTEMVKLLLKNGVNPFLVQTPPGKSASKRKYAYTGYICMYGTALHDAVRCGHINTVKALLQTVEDNQIPENHPQNNILKGPSRSSLANTKDSKDLTPLLAVGDNPTFTIEKFTNLVKILCEHGGDPRAKNPEDGRSLMYKAVELHAIEACDVLIKAGADCNEVDCYGDTPLHVALRSNFTDIAMLLLDKSQASINAQNQDGETPLHYAAENGSCCATMIKLLLQRGADLSINDNKNHTALEMVFANVPRPNSFFLEILNSKIVSNGYGINDRRFALTVDFSILSPNSCQQMSVVVAIMNSLRSLDRKQMLSHPLIDVYLRGKWHRLRVFFLGLFLLHLLFVASLSAHVICTVSDYDHVVWSRRVLLVTAAFLLLCKCCQISLAARYFFWSIETWLTLTCLCMSFIVAISGEVRSVVLEGVSADDRKPEHEEGWTRRVAAYAIILSWIQLIFVLGRFPTFGVLALMFFTILKNMVKVLVVFYCLIIGFAISFFIQNDSMVSEGVFASIIRTTMMLMGETQFDHFFPDEDARKICGDSRDVPRWQEKRFNLGATTQIIFLLFLFLGSIVLINLMIGLAVSDIQGLREQGLLQHMMKQAEFLLQTESILSKLKLFEKVERFGQSNIRICPTFYRKDFLTTFEHFVPSTIKRGKYQLIHIAAKSLEELIVSASSSQTRRKIPTNVKISPNCSRKMAALEIRRLQIYIPSNLMESLIKIALENQEGSENPKNFGDKMTGFVYV